MKWFVLYSCLVFSCMFLHGQCPEKGVLWKQMIAVRDNKKLSPEKRLEILLGFKDTVEICSYRNDTLHAYLLQQIGFAYAHLSAQPDYSNAISYLLESIRINENFSSLARNAQEQNMLSYFYLAHYYVKTGNTPRKIQAADSCIYIGSRIGKLSDMSCIRSLYFRVVYSYDVGDYHQCINYAKTCQQNALIYYKTVPDSSLRTYGTRYAESSFLWRLKAYLMLDSVDAAEQELYKKINIAKNERLLNYLGTYYSFLAEMSIHSGDYSRALKFYDTALKHDYATGRMLSCKQTCLDIGQQLYFTNQNNCQQAMAWYKKALTYKNKDTTEGKADTSENLRAYTQMGICQARMGKFDEALKNYQLAFNQLKRGINENNVLNQKVVDLTEISKIQYLSELLIAKADCYTEIYKTKGSKSAIAEAIRIYRITSKLMDTIKLIQEDPNSKLAWRSNFRRLYEHAIYASWLAKSNEDAFYFSEKSRAVLLSDQLTEQRSVSEKEQQQLAELRRRINYLQSAKKGSGEDELFKAIQDLERLTESIKTNNPLYYQSVLDSSFITIADVQQRILGQSHSIFASFFVGDTSIFSMLIGPSDIQIHKIDKQAFDSLSKTFMELLSDYSLLNRNFKLFNDVAFQLKQLLFPGPMPAQARMIISPGNSYFPFEALLTSKEPRRYFLEDYTVSYTYSARYLLNNFAQASPTQTKTFLGFAPVKYSYNTDLRTLNGSDQSLKKLRPYIKGMDNFTGTAASKARFMQYFPDYEIVQLYTHGDGSDEERREPVIYFSDSALYLSDLIGERKINAQLIVLSACETGVGKLQKGEGVFSFNRGFAALGIPAAISNLWEVEDQATYRITILFYKYLSDGLPTDEALQKAKLEFIRTSPQAKTLPYYWAAPVLVGKTGIIEIEKPMGYSWTITILSIAAIILILVILWIRGRKLIKTDIIGRKIPGAIPQ